MATGMPVESPARWEPHTGFGGRLAETEQPKSCHRAAGRPYFQALEDRFECWLLNAHHLRNVPGRKTDVKDSEWICQLVQHGLVRPSFVPPPEIRRLRDLTRLRRAHTNERGRTIQRLEKVLQDAGIKLSSRRRVPSPGSRRPTATRHRGNRCARLPTTLPPG